MDGEFAFQKDSAAYQRPQTSGGAFMRNPNYMEESFRLLNETAEDELDKELNDLIMRNQQRLNELHSDVK